MKFVNVREFSSSARKLLMDDVEKGEVALSSLTTLTLFAILFL
ncbi:MAG: hypothetical protein OHK0032_15690 [Thermodesulfovibrionales bacterium]